MSVQKTDEFIADVERQFEWYAVKGGWEVANRYLNAVEACCQLLGQHPQIGRHVNFTHPRLRDWRFFLAFRPFHKHILFYEIDGNEVLMRRTAHGSRDLQERLLEPPTG